MHNTASLRAKTFPIPADAPVIIKVLSIKSIIILIEQETSFTHFVPEVEAIATATLIELEHEGWRVIPTASATQLTMNREVRILTRFFC